MSADKIDQARECAARIAARLAAMDARRPLIKVETGYVVVDEHAE